MDIVMGLRRVALEGGGNEMAERKFESEAIQAQDDVLQMGPALRGSWHRFCYDLPLTVASEWLRFVSQRLEAQSEFLANLRTCQSVPEVMDVQSKFVRTAVDEYGAKTSKIMEDVRSTMGKAA
jgi:hypothetical protein